MFYCFLNFQYISEVRIDDIVYESVVNNQPTEYSNITLYCGMPSFPPFDGLLKNFKIEFIDDDQTENVVLGNNCKILSSLIYNYNYVQNFQAIILKFVKEKIVHFQPPP